MARNAAPPAGADILASAPAPTVGTHKPAPADDTNAAQQQL